jgi:microcystin-dependent protein
MAEPFIGEIKILGFNFAPRGWAFCDGQLLNINQNQALFSLLGTTYGGDGRTTFALPDLRGRSPIHRGPVNPIGRSAGAEGVRLTVAEVPSHDHELRGTSNPATDPIPDGSLLADSAPNELYHDPTNLVQTHAASVAPVGNDGSHNNMQPYLVTSFGIAVQGLFPSRN